MKLLTAAKPAKPLSRSPHGGRGLKLMRKIRSTPVCPSLPARGAWIETRSSLRRMLATTSLPARGAWIETGERGAHAGLDYVAPRTGGVD